MRHLRKIFLPLLLFALCGTSQAQWVKRNTNSFAWFKDIYFLNSSQGWISGTDGVLLATSDGGATWVQTKKFTNDNLVQVHFTDERNGWLLCERNAFNRGANAMSYVRKTADGGATWEKIEFENAGRERVVRILFGPNNRATAFGEGGVFYNLDEDGKTWKKSHTAMHYLLLDAAFANDRLGAIVGTGGTILFSEDAGFTWENATLLGETDTRFHSVFLLDGKGGWAVGSKGRIFRSNGGARLWRQQPAVVTSTLTDVYFTSAANGWAIGENGVILRSRDGGQNWAEAPSRTTHRLEKITFNGSRGWIVGFGGTVLTYDADGGPSDPADKPVLMKRS
jgi:photosystem II stability/assembly factor-like uncharacterized protein